MKAGKKTINAILLAAILAAYLFFVSNQTFLKKAFAYFGEHGGIVSLFFITAIFLALVAVFVGLLSFKYTLKPAAMFLIVSGASAGYFVDQYGVVINKAMIGSIVATTPQEAGEHISTELIGWLALTALLPCLLLLCIRVDYGKGWRALRARAAIVVVSAILTGAIVLANYSAFASTMRNHTDLMKSLNPAKPILSTARHFLHQARDARRTLTRIGTDAHRVSRSGPTAKPRVTVIVAGETARAKSFSLNGYDRQTNPELKARKVLNFSNVSSCGTHTGVSLPCMFSVFDRSEFREGKARYTENLLDVVQRAGIKVKWWDNNTSSAKVANRVPFESVYHIHEPPFCGKQGCFDEILVSRLANHLANLKDDAVLVLHAIGSHGPAYFRRVPTKFKRFQPACETATLSQCTRQEIINAYDNTIFYTDHVLSRIIDVLDSTSNRFDTAMIYMSDHGESTGEFGLYLHGMPYSLAPREQTWVPFVMWISDGLSHSAEIDMECMASRQRDALSHDNLFHSVLGLMDVVTTVYAPDLDIFSTCRSKTSARITRR
ncbi:MAG: phosphoethanolamine--lipid A transferase [Hyphomicrobiaceae bacterium]|nr:phosphoethanolamine--lipid A transferase [Hyphomicrobiaceae bacterium]